MTGWGGNAEPGSEPGIRLSFSRWRARGPERVSGHVLAGIRRHCATWPWALKDVEPARGRPVRCRRPRIRRPRPAKPPAALVPAHISAPQPEFSRPRPSRASQSPLRLASPTPGHGRSRSARSPAPFPAEAPGLSTIASFPLSSARQSGPHAPNCPAKLHQHAGFVRARPRTPN